MIKTDNTRLANSALYRNRPKERPKGPLVDRTDKAYGKALHTIEGVLPSQQHPPVSPSRSFPDQESLITTHLCTQIPHWDELSPGERATLIKDARGITVNRPDLRYTPKIPNLESFRFLQPEQRHKLKNLHAVKVDYSHNSPVNGQSYDEDGELVEVTSAVSSSDYRKSPNMHLLRRVYDEKTGETICYTGRPETEPKLVEQAEFIFRHELNSPQKKGLKQRDDGSWELTYAVESFLPSSPFFKLGSDPERRYLDQEIELLKKKPTLTIDGHTVHLKPILLHKQLNSASESGSFLSTTVSGEGRSKEVLSEGLIELKKYAQTEGFYSDPKIREYFTILENSASKLPGSSLLPGETVFYFTLLMRALNIPVVMHCKSSKDKTGFSLAAAIAAYNWSDCRLPERYPLIVGNALPKNKEEEDLVRLFQFLFGTHLHLAHYMTTYGLGGQGTLFGERMVEHTGLTISSCPNILRYLPPDFKDPVASWKKAGYAALFGFASCMTACIGVIRLVVGTPIFATLTAIIGLLSLAFLRKSENLNKITNAFAVEALNCIIGGVKDLSTLFLLTFLDAVPEFKFNELGKETFLFKGRNAHVMEIDSELEAFLKTLPEDPQYLKDPQNCIALGRHMDKIDLLLKHPVLKKTIFKGQKALINTFRSSKKTLLEELDYLSDVATQHLLGYIQRPDRDPARLTKKERELLLELSSEAQWLLSDKHFPLSERQRAILSACTDENVDQFLLPLVKVQIDSLTEDNIRHMSTFLRNESPKIYPSETFVLVGIANAMPFFIANRATLNQRQTSLLELCMASDRTLFKLTQPETFSSHLRKGLTDLENLSSDSERLYLEEDSEAASFSDFQSISGGKTLKIFYKLIRDLDRQNQKHYYIEKDGKEIRVPNVFDKWSPAFLESKAGKEAVQFFSEELQRQGLGDLTAYLVKAFKTNNPSVIWGKLSSSLEEACEYLGASALLPTLQKKVEHGCEIRSIIENTLHRIAAQIMFDTSKQLSPLSQEEQIPLSIQASWMQNGWLAAGRSLRYAIAFTTKNDPTEAPFAIQPFPSLEKCIISAPDSNTISFRFTACQTLIYIPSDGASIARIVPSPVTMNYRINPQTGRWENTVETVEFPRFRFRNTPDSLSRETWLSEAEQNELLKDERLSTLQGEFKRTHKALPTIPSDKQGIYERKIEQLVGLMGGTYVDNLKKVLNELNLTLTEQLSEKQEEQMQFDFLLRRLENLINNEIFELFVAELKLAQMNKVNQSIEDAIRNISGKTEVQPRHQQKRLAELLDLFKKVAPQDAYEEVYQKALPYLPGPKQKDGKEEA